MSGTRAISTTSRRELSSSLPPPGQGKTPKEIHAILIQTLACFLPGRSKDFSATLYLTCLSHVSTKRFKSVQNINMIILKCILRRLDMLKLALILPVHLLIPQSFDRLAALHLSGGKERPGRDANPSPPSSALVKKE